MCTLWKLRNCYLVIEARTQHEFRDKQILLQFTTSNLMSTLQEAMRVGNRDILHTIHPAGYCDGKLLIETKNVVIWKSRWRWDSLTMTSICHPACQFMFSWSTKCSTNQMLASAYSIRPHLSGDTKLSNLNDRLKANNDSSWNLIWRSRSEFLMHRPSARPHSASIGSNCCCWMDSRCPQHFQIVVCQAQLILGFLTNPSK